MKKQVTCISTVVGDISGMRLMSSIVSIEEDMYWLLIDPCTCPDESGYLWKKRADQETHSF